MSDEWVEVTPQQWLRQKVDEGKKRREELKQRIAKVLIDEEIGLDQYHDKLPEMIAEKILQEIEK